VKQNQEVVENQKRSQVKLENKAKKDFLFFLNEHKKELSTGFGAFHTDDHSNW